MVGVPSASSDGSRHAPAGYALIDLFADRIRIARRTVGEGGNLVTTSVEELAPSAAHSGLAG